MVKFIAGSIDFSAETSAFTGFFKDINQLRLIMPPEVDQWEANDDKCSFFIKNLGTMSMEKGFINPEAEYEFISTADSKVDFTLIFRLRKNPEGNFSGYFEIQTDVNPLVEMMVKRPLTNFVNLLTQNLKKHLS